MAVGARQSFQFFRHKAGFLGIKDLCLNLGIGFCIILLVSLNYKKTSPKKSILN